MSATLGSAGFRIWGDASGATNAVHQTNNALSQLEIAVATNWWGLRNLAMAFAALPAAVAAGTGVAIKQASEWQDAMVGVARTTGLTGDALEGLETQLQNIASTRPVAAVEIAGVAEAAGALGVLEGQIGQFTQAVVDFSTLTGMTTSAAATGLARIAALLGVAGSGFENLASSIFTVGVETAATEEEIISILNRLAATKAAVGGSADEWIGLSAAIRSAGIRSEMGATAIQGSFIKMAQAVSAGGEGLENWASVIGTTGEEFGQMFKDAPMQAFAQVVASLGAMSENGENVIGVLSGLGVTEKRQVQALLLLAAAQNQNVNENAKLTTALDYARQGMLDTTRAQEAIEARTRTLSGQMGVLRNTVFLAGSSFGEAFLPVLTPLIGLLSDAVRGFAAIPGPMRAFMGLGLLAVTVLTAMAAAIALIGPRIVIAIGFLRNFVGRLREVNAEVTNYEATIGQATGRIGQFSVAVAANNQKLVEQEARAREVAAVFAVMAGNQQTAAQVLQGYNTSVTQGTGFMQRYATSIGRATGAMAGLIATTILLTFWTARQGDAAEQAAAKRQRAASEAKRDLIVAMDNERRGQAGVTDETLRSLPAYQSATEASEELGLSVKQMDQIITGAASHQDFDQWMDQVTAAEDDGSEAAAQLRTDVSDLYNAFQAAQGVIGVTSTGLEDFDANTGAATQSTEELNSAIDELHDRLEAMAQAHIDYISAQFDQREAAVALKRAEEDLAVERARALDPLRELQDAEQELEQARMEAAQASESVHDAEIELSRARQEGLDDEADSLDNLRDLEDRYWTNLAKIMDLEEDINELREQSGVDIDKITDATLKLKDAQLDLVKANRKVEDAEWNLQHLREEGASARDISDAEFAIQAARQDAANAQDDINDTEKELAKLRDPQRQARELALAEAELAAARRESESITRSIRQEEQQLADIRTDIGNDQFYRDALDDLNQARFQERNAINGVRDAEIELDRVRSETPGQDLADAEAAYEEALYRVAEANVEVTKQQALMNGQIWDAGDAAHALADELGNLIANTPDPAVTAKLQAYIDALNSAPDVPAPRKKGNADSGLGGVGDIGLGGEDFGGIMGEQFDFEEGIGKSFGTEEDWKSALIPIAGMIIGALISALIQAAIGAAAGGTLMAGIVAVLPYAIVAALVAGIVALLIKSGWGAKILHGLFVGLQAATNVFVEIFEWIFNHIIEPFASAVMWLVRAGNDIATGLFNGLVAAFEFVWNFLLHTVPDTVASAFSTAVGWLVDAGAAIIKGLWDGIQWVWNNGVQFFADLPGKILSFLTGAATLLFNTGKNILLGLMNGVITAATDFFNFIIGLPGEILDFFDPIYDWFLGVGGEILRGLWNGIAEGAGWLWDQISGWLSDLYNGVLGFFGIHSPSKMFAGIGENLILGLHQGITDNLGLVDSAMSELQEAAQPKLAQFGLDYLLGSSGVGPLTMDHNIADQLSSDRPVVNNNENFNLEAITTADPTEIMNEYVWAQRVRTRGGT